MCCQLQRRSLTDPSGCALSADTVRRLRLGVPLPGTTRPARLVVFCDGFDELRAEVDARQSVAVRRDLRDFVATVCGGPAALWAPGTLKLVVTARDSRLSGRGDENRVFGAHARRVLLPLSKAKVSWVAREARACQGTKPALCCNCTEAVDEETYVYRNGKCGCNPTPTPTPYPS